MDVRSVVTKNKIKMALLNCIKEKPLANILNKDIIAKSEVSTRTFYHYYLDKDEVLNEIENEILADLKKVNDQDYQNVTQVSSPLTNETNVALAQKEFKYLIDYCDTVKEEGTILLSSNGDINFANKIRELSVKETKRRLDFLFENHYLTRKKKTEIPADIVINVYVETIVNTIITWLRSDSELSPYQVREILGLVQVKSPVQLLLLLKK